MQLFDELHAEGHTVIMVTHEDEIASHCNRVIEMKDGRIFRDSTQATAEVTLTGRLRDAVFPA